MENRDKIIFRDINTLMDRTKLIEERMEINEGLLILYEIINCCF